MRTHGCIDGEVYAVAALRYYAPIAQLPRAIDVFRICLAPTAALECGALWAADRPLYEAQRRSVGWMRRVECAV